MWQTVSVVAKRRRSSNRLDMVELLVAPVTFRHGGNVARQYHEEVEGREDGGERGKDVVGG